MIMEWNKRNVDQILLVIYVTFSIDRSVQFLNEYDVVTMIFETW